jgi:hypothetical protein
MSLFIYIVQALNIFKNKTVQNTFFFTFNSKGPIQFCALAWYAEFLLMVNINFLLVKTMARSNINIGLGYEHISPGLLWLVLA